MTVTEKGVKISTQSSIDHSVMRLLKEPNISLSQLKNKSDPCFMTLIIKYACDGTSGLSPLKQKKQDLDCSDESLFTAVPVQSSVECFGSQNNQKNDPQPQIIWKNPVPSSLLYCRLMEYQFSSETKEKTISVISSIKRDIEQLIPSKVVTDKGTFLVKVDVQLTMVDSKVCKL